MDRRKSTRSAAGIMCLALTLSSAGIIPKASNAASGSVSINEICAKNSVYAAPDGGMYDWIELYNSSSSPVDISGWGLSDKQNTPYMYCFPQGTTISGKGYLVVFCESKSDGSNNIAPFGLSTSGETVFLTDKNGSTADSVEFGILAENETFGQYPDGSGKFAVMNGTPNSANQASADVLTLKAPVFSTESGFYDSGFQLTLNAENGGAIYYTTDGSIPTASSQRYSSPIQINDISSNPNILSAHTDIVPNGTTAPSSPVDKANVIRAVVIDDQGNSSNVITKTYFVGKTASGYYKNMKVVSLVTDEANLFDYDTGIYCLGKYYDEWKAQNGGFVMQAWTAEANYTQSGRDWEREASFELFDNGSPVLSQNVGIRIKGAATRSNAQKSFNVFARKDYGTSNLVYDFFDGKNISEDGGNKIKNYDSITLRNGGNDNSYCFFRDCINQQLVKNRNFASQATSECMVFIDGEFWGLYQFTEKINDDFLKNHYGIKKSETAIVKNGELEEGTDADLQNFKYISEQLSQLDMKQDANYNEFCDLVDVQSYIDYFSAQIYWANGDWPNNNYAMWRSQTVDPENPYADGKWRMFLFDTEYSTGLYNDQNTMATSNSFQSIQQKASQNDECRLFTALLRNENFRERFALTFMDICNDNFRTDKIQELVNYYQSTYGQQVSDTWARYGVNITSGGGWGNWGGGFFPGMGGPGQQPNEPEETTQTSKLSMDPILSFYNSRFNSVTGHMKSALGLNGSLNNITVGNESSKGTIKLNTVDITEDSWNGKYYSDYAITLKAQPSEGYKFVRWEVSGGDFDSPSLNYPTLSLKLTSDATVRAVYAQGDVPSLQKGDYNGDGTVNAADIVTLNKYLLKRTDTIADTDMIEDGITNVFDLVALRKQLFDE